MYLQHSLRRAFHGIGHVNHYGECRAGLDISLERAGITVAEFVTSLTDNNTSFY